MKHTRFVAIDFEYLTQHHETACAVGMVKVIESIIVQEFYSLIKPMSGERNHLNTSVHGITEDMCADAPTFEEIYPMLEQFIDGLPLVAHHSSTEELVIEKACNYYGIENRLVSSEGIIDTMPMCGGKSLEDACSSLGIPLPDHHNPLYDAQACAKLYVELSDGKLIEPMPSTGFKKRSNPKPEHLYKPLPEEEIDCKDTVFYHKNVLVTGDFTNYPDRNQLLAVLRRMGAINNRSMLVSTEILIAGNGAGWSKLEKSAERGIRIMYEEELMDIVNAKGR